MKVEEAHRHIEGRGTSRDIRAALVARGQRGRNRRDEGIGAGQADAGMKADAGALCLCPPPGRHGARARNGACLGGRGAAAVRVCFVPTPRS